MKVKYIVEWILNYVPVHQNEEMRRTRATSVMHESGALPYECQIITAYSLPLNNEPVRRQ